MPSKKTSKSPLKKPKKLTPTEKLKNTIEQLEISLNESSEKHLRLKAEFDNFRKSTIFSSFSVIYPVAKQSSIH